MAFNGALFGTVQVGDYAFAVAGGQGNLVVETIPRSLGSIIKFLGGGLQTLTVNAWIINFKELRRKELEEFFRDLENDLLKESPADLIINGVTYKDSFYSSLSLDGSHRHFENFSVEFLRSSTKL